MKRWFGIGLGVVVFGVLCFGAGRFAAPTKVQTVVKTETVEKIVEKKVEVAAKTKVVYVDRVITKEGEVRERIVEREVEKSRTDTDRTNDRTDTTESSKTVESDAPRLNVSVLAGVDLNPKWQPIEGAGPLSLGLSVNYRIAGPLTVGAWGLHTGVFGISLGATF